MRLASLVVCLASSFLIFASTPIGNAQPGGQPAAQDNSELRRMYDEDQSDRRPPEGTTIDWPAVAERDRAREARVKELYSSSILKTGPDYYHAAMVLMHSNDPASHLLAHELAIVAAIKGVEKAKWLIAASEDRFLMNMGRPQRFGTQYRSLSPEEPMKLHDIDGVVTDAFRQELNVPSLEKARERERQLGQK